jgi:glutathione synthase
MNIVFQMDAPHKINPKTDTTLLLMQAFLAVKASVLYYEPNDLFIENGEVFANVCEFSGDLFAPKTRILGFNMADSNAVFVRQDPPFDMSYITSLYALKILKKNNPKVRFVNEPEGILSLPEKLSPLFNNQLKNYLPKTLITHDFEQVKRFRETHTDIIIKPLYGFAGEGVFLLKNEDKNLLSVYEAFKRLYQGLPMIIQEYLPSVQEADKRVIIINGQVRAFFARVQAPKAAVSGIRTGASVEACELTKTDIEISKIVAKMMLDVGILIAGIDIIGEKLTEINVTCPTGFPSANRLCGVKLEDEVVKIVLDSANL